MGVRVSQLLEESHKASTAKREHEAQQGTQGSPGPDPDYQEPRVRSLTVSEELGESPRAGNPAAARRISPRRRGISSPRATRRLDVLGVCKQFRYSQD